MSNRTGRPRWYPRLRRVPRAHGVVGEVPPLPTSVRRAAYQRQTGAVDLTSRQQRRLRHKQNRAVAASTPKRAARLRRRALRQQRRQLWRSR